MARKRPGNLRARNHAILHVISRAHAPDCSERILAAFPEQFAFSGRLRDAHLAGAASRQTSAICTRLLLDGFG